MMVAFCLLHGKLIEYVVCSPWAALEGKGIERGVYCLRLKIASFRAKYKTMDIILKLLNGMY